MYKYIYIYFINVEIINDVRNIDERSRKKEKKKFHDNRHIDILYINY